MGALLKMGLACWACLSQPRLALGGGSLSATQRTVGTTPGATGLTRTRKVKLISVGRRVSFFSRRRPFIGPETV